MTREPVYAVIDVSKATLDVAVRPASIIDADQLSGGKGLCCGRHCSNDYGKQHNAAVMGYKISAVFVVYHGGRAELQPAIARTLVFNSACACIIGLSTARYCIAEDKTSLFLYM